MRGDPYRRIDDVPMPGVAVLVLAAFAAGCVGAAAVLGGWWSAVAAASVLLAAAAVVLWLRRQWLALRRRWILARTDLSAIDRMAGREFEYAVAELMRESGYRKVAVVGGGGDGGADIRAETPDGRACVVQCKRLRRPVPPNEVRAFQGTLAHGYRGYLGIFVAANGFSEIAETEARSSGIVPVGRAELALWLRAGEPPRLSAPK